MARCGKVCLGTARRVTASQQRGRFGGPFPMEITMKTVTIREPFDGYPSGKLRTFLKGEEAEVPDAFADTIIEKKLATEKAPAVADALAPVAKAERAAKKDAAS